MPTIQTETKEHGSWSQYLEVGVEKIDAFGDVAFARKGYAREFPGLTVQRKMTGNGAATYCKWMIEIADDFVFSIRKVTNPGGGDRQRKYEILYRPVPSTVIS